MIILLAYASFLFYSLLPLFWLFSHFLVLRGICKRPEVFLATSFSVFSIALFFLFPGLPLHVVDIPSELNLLGLLIVFSSVLLDLWCLFLLGSKFNPASFRTSLISSFPYSLVRHPIYLSHVAINLGLFLATGSLVSLAVFLEWLLLLKPLADLEDNELEQRLGKDYSDYKRKVGKLWPKL